MFYNAYLGTLNCDVNLEQLDGSFGLLDLLSESLKHSSRLSYLTAKKAEAMGLKHYYPDYDSCLYTGSKAAILKCLEYMGEDTEKYTIRMENNKEYALLLIVEEYSETRLNGSWEIEEFWSRIEDDLNSRVEVKYSGLGRSFTIKGSAGGFALDCEDWGEVCGDFFGRDEYEFHYTLDTESARAFITALRKNYGTELSLQELMNSIFCCDSGTVKFSGLLDAYQIKHGFFSY